MKPFLTGRAQHDQPSLARDVTSGGGLASLNKAGGATDGAGAGTGVAGGAGGATASGQGSYPPRRPVKHSAIAANAHAHSHDQNGGAGGGGAPSVECIKQGDKVVRLIVTCSCGERIEIDCLYPSAS